MNLLAGDHNAEITVKPKRSLKDRLRRVLLATAAVAVLSGASFYGYDYVTVGRFLVSTDDAYVKADNTTIAPKVSGYLTQVLVGDNERVGAGQMLARIDDRDFRVALAQAKADVAATQAAIASKQAQFDAQQAIIDAAKATLDVDKAQLTFAEQENKRYSDLATSGYGSVQNAQQAQSRISTAQATLQRDNANLASALKQVDLLKADISEATAQAARAEAAQAQAELNLTYTTITAPIDGVVGNRTLRARPIRAGRHATDVGGARQRRLCRRQLQGDAADRRAQGPGRRHQGRHVPGPGRARPRRQHRAGERPGIRAAAARQRHRQLHQGGAAHPREDRARCQQPQAIDLRPGMSVIPTIETHSDRHVGIESRRCRKGIGQGFIKVVPCPIPPHRFRPPHRGT